MSGTLLPCDVSDVSDVRGPIVSNVTNVTGPAPRPLAAERRIVVTVLPGDLVDRVNASRALGVSPKTLANWQALMVGPEPRRMNGRVRYVWSDVQAFAAGSAVQHG